MDVSELLQALDLADRGEWDTAHTLVQSRDDAAGAWVHANLHREEGDDGNAAYWYAKAGKEPSTKSFADERAEIRAALAPSSGV
ncbi:MAG: hypothetical protein JJU00_12220 [Opitutales bacterium]|nr:hypothetical protein [Opitutales bacterium]